MIEGLPKIHVDTQDGTPRITICSGRGFGGEDVLGIYLEPIELSRFILKCQEALLDLQAKSIKK